MLKFLTYAMAPAALYFLIIPFQQITADTVMPLMILSLLITITVLTMAGVAALQGSRTATYLFSSWLLIILAYGSFFAYKINLIERAETSSTTGEPLAIGAALLLLMSIAEFIRTKSEEFVEARLETKAKGDFLRNVSREFLTPVHLILANSKRLLAAQSNKLDEATRAHMTTVIKQSDHLHNLINGLLEMAELESDSFEPEFELVEISHFLNEVRDMILPSALEKGLEITTQFASSNLLVQTDKSRLQHALLNLLTNAIKYTAKGSIRVGYKAVYFRRHLGIEIFIQDTGRGMSASFQQRLFQEFSREDDDAEKTPEGTGLGLVIVKRMIEKLGGEIGFLSAKDEGSTFFIRLPLRTGNN
ncbi:MAG: HAMP domain-containing histidine kinase [Gammaproteobacteria bacterium]|nr:HAMP domain-containing histidine kinase [Gammaproteobacteria bacterium]